jgi:hypothetical protein
MGAEDRDQGCDLAPSCLDCPFAQCRHDRGRRGAEAADRRRRALLAYDGGLDRHEAAAAIGISERTLSRALHDRRVGELVGTRV